MLWCASLYLCFVIIVNVDGMYVDGMSGVVEQLPQFVFIAISKCSDSISQVLNRIGVIRSLVIDFGS